VFTAPSPPPPAELTALDGVILPALEAALQRRTYQLNARLAALRKNGNEHTTANSTTTTTTINSVNHINNNNNNNSSSSNGNSTMTGANASGPAHLAALEQQQREQREREQLEQEQLQHCHQRVRRLVFKAAGIFKELDRLDSRMPVGMGGEVHGFLEGLLEEILVRVEAEEEEEDDNVDVGS
jgi:serine/threonine-protein kinase 24/25/MST4